MMPTLLIELSLYMDSWSSPIGGVAWIFTFALFFGTQNLAPGESVRGAKWRFFTWLMDKHTIICWELAVRLFVIASISYVIIFSFSLAYLRFGWTIGSLFWFVIYTLATRQTA